MWFQYSLYVKLCNYVGLFIATSKISKILGVSFKLSFTISHIICIFIFHLFQQEYWKYDPFEAVKDEKGDIYARGTQVYKPYSITLYLHQKYNSKMRIFYSSYYFL